MPKETLTAAEERKREAKEKKRQQARDDQKVVKKGEKEVSALESEKLQKEGAIVLGVYMKGGVKVHKIKMPD